MKKTYLTEILRQTVRQVLKENSQKTYKLSELTFRKLQELFPDIKTPSEAFHLPSVIISDESESTPKPDTVAIGTEDRFNAYKDFLLKRFEDISFEINPKANTWIEQIKQSGTATKKNLTEDAVTDAHKVKQKKVKEFLKKNQNDPKKWVLEKYLKIKDPVEANLYWVKNIKPNFHIG